LSGSACRVDSDREQEAVFTGQQIEALSENLAKGLANARPDQDVIFSLEKSVRRLIGTQPKHLYVAGRAFYKDDKLNFIIGEYDSAGDEGFEAAYDPTHVGILAYDFDHGRRTAGTRVFNKVSIKAPGVEYRQLNGTRRNDWLVIDLRSASEAVDAGSSMREAEENSRKREDLTELSGGEEGSATVPAQVPPAAPATQSFEHRLTTLKTLRDKGLITDEEYEIKRRQILDEL